MLVQFGYRNCVVYGNAGLNTSNLQFDCDGGTVDNPEQFMAQIIAPPNAQPGLTVELNGQYAKAVHATASAISLTITGQSPSQPAAPGTMQTRTFTVNIGSLSTTAFDLRMNMETDVTVEGLWIVANGQTDILPVTPSIYSDFQTFTVADIPANYITQIGNTRRITFRQRVTLNCAPASVTTVNARVACPCVNSAFFNANQITLNGIAGSVPTFNIASTNLIPIDSATAPCSGLYEYWVPFSVSGTSASLNQVQIPINTASFQVQAVSIGVEGNFTDIANYTVNNSNPAQSTIIFNASDNFDSINPWPGFTPTFNNINGAWFQMPISGSLQIIIKIRLMYECNSVEACQSAPVQLSPSLGNSLMLNLTNTCLSSYNQPINLPNIAAPSTIASTVSGGCIPFNIDVGSISNAPFSYFINLPNSSPFQLNRGNTTLFDCNEVSYRALLSITSPANANMGNLTGLIINGQNAVAQNIGGNWVFDLPPGTNPNHPASSYTIQFTLHGITCPDPDATFGSIEYNLTLQALCNDCIGNPCVKNLGCNTDILFVHCPGDCDGKVGIAPGLTIHRTTFGWVNPEAYPANPLTNLDFITDVMERENQFRRLYPFDLFRIAASGSVQPTGNANDLHQHLSFEMAYSNSALGDHFFDLVGYQVTFRHSATNQSITINNQNIPYEFVTAAENAIPGLNAPMWVRELRWQADDLTALGININTAAWQIENFEATFRVTSAQPIGFHEVDFLCQFRATSQVVDINGDVQSSTQHTSCDPYGSSLLILIPDVELAQQSVQTGSLLLPGDTQNQPAAVITTNQTCRFGHAIGIRHRGGLGNQVDDFPFEFRPLTAWPHQLESNQVLEVNDLYNGPFSYSATTPFTNTGNPNNLLPPLEKGQITDLYQGLVLSMSRTCPINSPSPIPITLPINRHAYLHSGHNMNANNPLPVLNPSAIGVPAGMACGNMTNLVGQAPISLSNFQPQYAFRLSAPEAAQGLPVVFRFYLTGNNIPQEVSLGNLIYEGLSLTPNSAGWYVFEGGWPNVTSNNSSIPITLGNDGCLSAPFQIKFEWRIFCTEAQMDAFLTDNTQTDNCGACSVTRTFQRNTATITADMVTNNFTREGCDLVWTLNIINQAHQATIDLSQLNLNFATGLIYQSANLEIVSCENTNPALIPPNFILTTQSEPVTATFIETTLSTANLQLHPACTLRYTLRFQLGEDLCNSFENNSTLIQAHLSGKNVCNTEFNIQPLAINHSQVYNLIQLLKNQTPSCCVPLPPIAIQHSCGGAPGHISFENSLGFPVQVSLLVQGSTLGSQTVAIGETYNSGPLTAGTYGLVIQNMANGAFFSQTFTINAHPLPTVTITGVTTICAGQSTTLTAEPTPANAAIQWTNGPATQNFTVSQAGIYTATATHNSCLGTANTQVVVNPTPETPLFDEYVLNACATEALNISPLNYNINSDVNFQWSGYYTSASAIFPNPVTLDADIEYTGTFQLSVINSFECAATSDPILVNLEIEYCPCACVSNELSPALPTSVQSYQDLVSMFGNTISNQCLSFQNDIIITADLFLNNCNIVLAPGVQIINQENNYFYADNCIFRGCEAMWRGIQNFGYAKFTQSTIRDAHTAFEMMRVDSSFPWTYLDGITFSHNFIGLTNSINTGNHSFKGPLNCRFEGGALLPGYNGQNPTPNPLGGHAGMVVRNSFTVSINETNTFSNLYNGIVIWRSLVKVYKAKFENIQYDPSSLLYPNNLNSIGNLQIYGNFGLFPSAAINAGFNSRVSIYGLGTAAEDEVMFYGCRRGITTHRSDLWMEDVKIDGENQFPTEIGVWVVENTNFRTFTIINNRIRSQMAGIVLTQNGNYTNVQGIVDNNNITILDNYDLSATQNIDPSISKFGIFASSELNSKGIMISNNTINMRSWHNNHGFVISQSNNIVARSNYLRRFTPSTGSGFRVQANQGAFISCNHSIGMDNDVLQAFNDAYSVANSSVYLRENYSNLTQTGFNINENCTGIDLYNNEMGTHTFNSDTETPSGALYLGLNAQIGTQTDKFNLFTGQTSVAVKHPFNILPGIFLVDPLFIPSMYYPLHVPNDPNNDCTFDPFFQCFPNQFNPIEPSEPCGTSAGGSTIQGMSIANPGGAVSVAEALAKGELSYSVYNEESKFEVSKSVERGLKENSIALPDTGFYVAWKDSLFQSNAARLNSYSYIWHKEELDESYLLQAQSWKQAATTAFDSTIAWLSEIQEAEDFETSQWQQRYLILKNMHENADNQLEALKLIEEGKLAEKRDSATYWNHEVSNIKDYETMEKTINEIYLNTLAMGEFSFSPTEMEQITIIAWQCPLKSAAAVYKARSMYALVHPFTRFDNYSICNAQGMQYRMVQQAENTKHSNSMLLYPNPSTSHLTIDMQQDNGKVNFVIYNALGQKIHRWQSNEIIQNIDLVDLNLSSGLFVLQAQGEDGKIYLEKFIYQNQ